MPYSPVIPIPAPPPVELRPNLVSYDSGRACSIDHWLEITRLVEKEDVELKGYLKGYLLEDTCFTAMR